jgi:hypothetical protein
MIEDTLARHYQADALPAGHPVREAIAELRRLRGDLGEVLAWGQTWENEAERRSRRYETDVAALRADAARYRWLAARMVHVAHPAGAGWTLDEVLVSGDRDLDEVIDAMAKEQICGLAKSGQIPGAK